MQRPALFLSRLGMYCLAPIGVLLLLVTASLVCSKTAWLAGTVEAQGTVTEMLRFQDREGTGYVYAPVVRFATAEGRTIEFHSGTRTYPPAYRKGETVTVVYDPDEPQSAAIRGFISLWLGPLIAGFIGFVFLAVGAAMTLGGWYANRTLQQPAVPI
jgi:hypothetical protein